VGEGVLSARDRAASFLGLYNAAATFVAAVSMGLIVVIMGVQVFFRYALNDSLIWAEEICRYLLMVMTFLLIGPAFQRGEMVSVQFLMHALPPRVANALMIPVYLLMIGFLITISWFGFHYASLNSNFSMPSVDFILSGILRRQVSNAMSMYWIYMLIPVGCLILSVHLVVAMIGTVGAVLKPGKAA
jgi:TRAP-type C4-dicarboxylate transport system permease small subunit